MKDLQDISGNILGIDYGQINIGVAIGNNGIVSPLKVLPGKNQNSALYEINRLVIEHKISAIVLGIPLSYDDKETKESIVVRRFAKLLKIATKRPVIFQNEYGSSKDALKEALSLGVSKKNRASNDQIAAALILKMFYDERGNTQD